MHKFLSVVLFFFLACSQGSCDMQDFKKIAENAIPKVKELFGDKDKLTELTNNFKSQLDNLLNGSKDSDSSLINNDFLKKQMLTMMLKAFENSIKGNQSQNAGFLNAESLTVLMQMIQQYKSLFSQDGSNAKKNSSIPNATDNQYLKDLMVKMANNSLNGWMNNNNSDGNSTFENAWSETLMKSFLSQLMNSKVDQTNNEDSDRFNLKNLNNLMDNLKELNKTIDRQQLKEMGNLFKDFFSGAKINETEENDRERMNDDGGSGALSIIIISIVIFLVALLMMVRCYCKKKQFLASRMIEHKPLASHEITIK